MTDEIPCPWCGATGNAGAQFCGKCGEALVAISGTPHRTRRLLAWSLGGALTLAILMLLYWVSGEKTLPHGQPLPSWSGEGEAVGSDSSGPAVPTTDPRSTTTTLANLATGIASLEWTRVSWQAAFDGSLDVAGDGQVHLFDVVATDSELVAAGLQSFGDPMEGTDGERAVVVVSEDGLNWERILAPDLGASESENIRIEGLADIGNGILAVGSTLDPVVWLSEDAKNWSVLYSRPEPIGFGIMRDVTRAEAGLIAVGHAREEAGIWISTYGPEWIRFEGSDFSTQGILDVIGVTTGPAGVVAVGNERFQLPDGHSDWDASVWVSENGNEWTRVIDDTTFAGGQTAQMTDVAAGGPGFVAVGSDDITGDLDAAVWVSEDGRTWTRVDSAGLAAPGTQTMLGVASGPAGLVAVGADSAAGTEDAAIWVSENGFEWTRVEHPGLIASGYQLFRGVTAWQDRFVAVGYEGGDALVWIGSPGGGPDTEEDG